MELTAKEKAIKEIVLEKFKQPGYAEKKHLIEVLDRDWLDDEIDKMRTKGGVFPWVLIIGGCLMAIVWGVQVVFYETTAIQKASGILQMLFWAAAGGGGGLVHLHSRRKRLFIYRILSVIAGGREQVAPMQPARERLYESS